MVKGTVSTDSTYNFGSLILNLYFLHDRLKFSHCFVSQVLINIYIDFLHAFLQTLTNSADLFILKAATAAMKEF